MKLGRFEHQGRRFFGVVEGDGIAELQGSPFDEHRSTDARHESSPLKALEPMGPFIVPCHLVIPSRLTSPH